jgi:pyruvate ferredoxin oxidoreductase alpha subunit
MEIRYKVQQAHEKVKTLVNDVGDSFGEAFGRSYGAIEAVDCDDAETVLVTSSSTTSPARVIVKEMREAGVKMGLLKIRMFRPFPVEDIKKVLLGKAKAVVIDRNISFGKGGIFADELRGALADEPDRPLVYGYITGLGGRDITPDLIREIVQEAEASEKPESPAVWKGLKP